MEDNQLVIKIIYNSEIVREFVILIFDIISFANSLIKKRLNFNKFNLLINSLIYYLNLFLLLVIYDLWTVSD
jgi:hypothetical protein